jgi:hypothetical protein
MMILLLLLQLGNSGKPIESAQAASLRIVRPLSAASLPPSFFGDDWEARKGIIADDLERLTELPGTPKNMLNQLKAELGRQGIVGVADYSVVKTKPPLNTITVRVFVFSDEQKCDEWWQKKYRFDGWQKHYQVVKDDRYTALDSLKKKYPYTNKRILKFDKVWITTHQLGEGNAHVNAADHIIEQLTQIQP